MKVAAIDLGSNTFHLLIVEGDKSGIGVEIYRERVFVGLGDGGIEHLDDEAIERGLNTCLSFRKAINHYGVEKLRVTGTAALRNASNAQEFTARATAILGVKIEIIDGLQEANLIFEGVRQLSDLNERTLIVDIGGGSTEFIIAEKGELVWAESFLLGVGVMHAAYHKEEPIGKLHENELRKHIENTLLPLRDELERHNVTCFIGASGSFEVLESMTGRPSFKNKLNTVEMADAHTIAALIIGKNLQERAHLPGMPIERVKLIVVAMILIEEILKMTKEVTLKVTPYALKEGLLAQLLKNI
ncbi:MAG: hypothetical protein KBF57_04630 [Saprospiraceae bacterium]|jgi:exopolyphosphatase/guanosine-5'-triphosphate,3'-diphosphate pyrophosphatase|nr:hypothetical protein [Saprospiraceae bacterium]MBP9193945.1 hypothetical protein [Saprospiraceae bacterium]